LYKADASSSRLIDRRSEDELLSSLGLATFTTGDYCQSVIRSRCPNHSSTFLLRINQAAFRFERVLGPTAHATHIVQDYKRARARARKSAAT